MVSPFILKDGAYSPIRDFKYMWLIENQAWQKSFLLIIVPMEFSPMSQQNLSIHWREPGTTKITVTVTNGQGNKIETGFE